MTSIKDIFEKAKKEIEHRTGYVNKGRALMIIEQLESSIQKEFDGLKEQLTNTESNEDMWVDKCKNLNIECQELEDKLNEKDKLREKINKIKTKLIECALYDEDLDCSIISLTVEQVETIFKKEMV